MWFSNLNLVRSRYEPPREPEKEFVPFIPPDDDRNDSLINEPNENKDVDNNVAIPQTLSKLKRSSYIYRPSGTIPFIPPEFEGSNEITESTNDSSNGETNIISQEMETTLMKLKPYRFRPSKNAWKHVVTFGLRNDIPPEEKKTSVFSSADYHLERRFHIQTSR